MMEHKICNILARSCVVLLVGKGVGKIMKNLHFQSEYEFPGKSIRPSKRIVFPSFFSLEFCENYRPGGFSHCLFLVFFFFTPYTP